MDAAFKGPARTSGLGEVLRTKEGDWILGFTKTTFARDQGMQEGLKLTLHHGFKKLVLFSDCMKAMQLIDHEITQTNIYTDVRCKCRELARKFEGFKIRHCRRQDNKLADQMAKYCM